MLIDSHCHLDYPDLTSRLDEIISNAKANGVELMISISTKVHERQRLVEIAEIYDNVFFSIGTHPHHADKELDITAEQLVDLASHPKCVAIGEVGLDYFYDNAPVEAQKHGFHTHIEAARETGLPLVIHSRDAEKDTIDILEKEMAKGAFKPLMHCFSASQWLADEAVKLGGYISFSGIVTFKNSQSLRDTAATIPSDRYIVETDAPFLAPMPFRGKKNEPAFVKHTAEYVAEARGISFEQVCKETVQNTFDLFSKLPQDLK